MSFKPLKISNALSENHIYIFDEIDSSWGFSSSDLIQALADISNEAPLTVHINSIGGDVFEGLAIYNILRQRQNVTTVVEGIAASIASIIFLAGDKRTMHEQSMLMVHNASAGVHGTADDFENMLDLLQKAGEQITAIYLSNSSLDEAGIKSLLGKDSFLTSEESLSYGFATEVISVPNVTATANINSLVAKLFGSTDMKFETWLVSYCKPLALDSTKLTVEQRTSLKAIYDAEQAATAAIPVAKVVPPPVTATLAPDIDLGAQMRQQGADETARQGAISDIAANFASTKFNEDYLTEIGVKAKTVRGLSAHAIRENWSVDKFELTCRRAEQPSVGHVGIHVSTTEKSALSNQAAVSCALVRNAGIPSQGKHNSTGEKYGYEEMFSQETLESSDHPSLRNVGLLQIFEQAHIAAYGSRYDGRMNTDGFIQATREAMWKLRNDASNTTWGGLNIFDDAANKMLWAAYNAINTTWQEWVYPTTVTDFKTHNFYRMTMEGGYQKLGSDGRLKHGGLGDDKYQTSADTFGKIVGLSRRDLINDDLGALNRIMSGLGIEGARFLEELFYAHFLNQTTTIFPIAGTNNNYISGATTALGVDALTTGEKTFADQVDSDGAPILINSSILLVGNTLSVPADELFTQVGLRVAQTVGGSAKGRPDSNPHVGKYRPVVSGYLDNTSILQRTDSLDDLGAAIPNQSGTQWFLLPSPNNSMGGVLLGAFLNGVRTPTIESADQAFDVLGLQWRSYHDAGVSNGDPKLAVMSKGAA